MSDTKTDLSILSDEDLATAIEAKKSELATAVDAMSTTEEIDAAEALSADLDAHVTEQGSREAAATALAARKQALADKTASFSKDPEPVEDPKEEEPSKEEAPAEDPAPEAEPAAPVEAANKTPKPGDPDYVEPKKTSASTRSVAELAARTSKPTPPPRSRGINMPTITAAANLDSFAMAQTMENGIADIVTAVTEKTSGFTVPDGDGTFESIQKFPIARISLGFDETNTIDRKSDDMAILASVTNEHAIKSRDGEEFDSLVAAGGWCAPSETLYDLCEGETLDGLVSLPEINIARGGINYTPGPAFSDFYTGGTGPGFVQTEAQAIAGNSKACVTLSCPAFQEVRMDAVGLCLKIPILTESAYPELVARSTRGFLVAHAHQVNADIISRMVALSNASRTIALTGSSVDDSLEGLELLANEKREKYRLGFNDTLEVVIPFWVKAVFRADLSRRQGVTPAEVTDAAIEAHFSARGLNVQWVYDWQLLGQTALAYATTYRVLMYKAGTFVKGTSDVISLSAVYDAASLAVNTYTGLFAEQGLLVAKMCWDADNVLLPICNAGRRGALNITCA